MSGAFPERPKGDPAGIRGAADDLVRVAGKVELAIASLRGASGTMDWSGWAQSRYIAAAQGLGDIGVNATETFLNLAQTTKRYAGELDRAQTELDRLRRQYDQAMQSAADARQGAANLAHLKAHEPDPVTRSAFDSDITRLNGAAADADGDAERLRRRAQQVRDDFDDDARNAAAALRSGRPAGGAAPLGAPATPFAGGPGAGKGLGPGFGVPPGGLDDYDGTLPTNYHQPDEMPGFGMYSPAGTTATARPRCRT